MSGPTFEKVLLDKSFTHCQSIYVRLTSLLNEVDMKQVGDINQINEKIIALDNDMYKLLCIAESLLLYDQKVKENRATKSGQRSSQGAMVPKVGRIDQTPSSVVASTSKINKVDTTMFKIYNTISFLDDEYKCNFCDVMLNSIDSVISHNRSLLHKDICKNPTACFHNLLKDYCNIDAFWNFVPLDSKISKIYVQPTGYTCTLCDCDLPNSLHGIYMHIRGKKHLKILPAKLLLEQ